LCLDEIQQFLVGLVQTEPYHTALIACDCAKILDSDIPHALAIPIEGAGDDSSSRGRICSLGGKVEHVSQIF